MTIVSLTYYSRNRIERAGAQMHDRIHDILIESVANNRRDDITGQCEGDRLDHRRSRVDADQQVFHAANSGWLRRQFIRA